MMTLPPAKKEVLEGKKKSEAYFSASKGSGPKSSEREKGKPAVQTRHFILNS